MSGVRVSPPVLNKSKNASETRSLFRAKSREVSPPVLQEEFYDMLTYVKESWEELKNNVTWLNREQASNLMVVVAVFSIFFELATWGVDTVFSKLIALYFEQLIG